jgi:hypothetical protein
MTCASIFGRIRDFFLLFARIFREARDLPIPLRKEVWGCYPKVTYLQPVPRSRVNGPIPPHGWIFYHLVVNK